MESNKENNVGRWVEDRLAALTPPDGWQPDTAMGLQRLKRERDSGTARFFGAWHGTRVWAGAAVVATCGCVLAFPATRVLAQRCVNACLMETGLRNRAPAADPAPEGVIASSRRRPAPDFTLPGVSANPVRLSDLRGEVVLLNFWATWCAPCNVEIPWFVELQRRYGDAGFAVLGISMDEDGWKSVKPYLQEKKVDYAVVVGTDEIARNFDIAESLPTTFLIDKAGRIASIQRGLGKKKPFEEAVKALIEEENPRRVQ
jgi:peroxiredoxin